MYTMRYRLRFVRRRRFWRYILRGHRHRWRLRRFCVQLPGQSQVLHSDVEKRHANILAGDTVQSCSWTWNTDQSRTLGNRTWTNVEKRLVEHREHGQTGENIKIQFIENKLKKYSHFVLLFCFKTGETIVERSKKHWLERKNGL